MKIIVLIIGILMIVATVLPLLRKDAWWIRIFDFPRLQITVVTILTLVAYLFLRGEAGLAENLFLVALALCVLYQAYMMFPYTILSPKQVQKSRKQQTDAALSALFVNVLRDNRRAEKLKEIIREADPDIILAVETNDWWTEQLGPLAETHPYVVSHPQDNYYGMLLFSRLELVNPEVKFQVEDDVPSIRTGVRLRSDHEIVLYCLHPRPPLPQEQEQTTERDAELLIVGREIEARDLPAIVMGDLNDVAWSRTNYRFQRISGLLDPRIGRGFYNTFNAKYPFIRMPLDHFFHSDHFRLIELRRLPHFGSDHFPMFVSLSYEPEGMAKQQQLQANAADQAEAQEALEKVNVAG